MNDSVATTPLVIPSRTRVNLETNLSSAPSARSLPVRSQFLWSPLMKVESPDSAI